MRRYVVVLAVGLLFVKGALFGETGEEKNSQYWKTRYLSGSDYGSQYNVNHDMPENSIQNHESSPRTLFSWNTARNNSQHKSNGSTHFFSENSQNSVSNKAKNPRKDNIWWPWSNYEEWASSRKHDDLVNHTTQLPKTPFRHPSEPKKKKRKKKKSRKHKKTNINSTTQSSSENSPPKNMFFLPNSITNYDNNYPATNRDTSIPNKVKYESNIQPPRSNWDNNELDNEIHPRYNYYESIPLMNTKNIVFDKIKKHRNYDHFMKSYSSRNFTNDVNECLNDNGGCEGLCINTPGSYKCHCPDGFKLDMNKCVDINECLLRNGHGPCQDKCINEWGSYKCSCENIPGTRLATDGHTCEDVDECKEGAAGCSHDCINTVGSAFCLCPSGFILGMDWKTCSDIDECAVPEMQDNKCEKGCENTIGSYVCL
ncbi:GATA zinc finger domain-containing protein 14-like [Planococcus citri]|uniref:GATA zinc finger domain-containing protein 14-like n=1 Tax=Planococcus citri TaxID=170843 RepID=UPI0031F8BD17